MVRAGISNSRIGSAEKSLSILGRFYETCDESSARRCEKLCSEELMKCLDVCNDYFCESSCFR